MVQRLLIDSRDRTTTSNLTLATFELDVPIENVSRVRLDWAMVYNTFQNVTSEQNTIVVDGIAKTIAAGNYTQQSLVAAVDAKLKEVDTGIGVVWSSTTYTATWTLGGRTIDKTNTTMRYLLGLNDLSTLTGTFSSFVNVTSPNSIHFYSPELQSGTDVYRRTNRNNIHATPFLSMPVYGAYQTLNYYQSNFPLEIKCEIPQTLQRLTIYCEDAVGRSVVNQTEFQIQLSFFE